MWCCSVAWKQIQTTCFSNKFKTRIGKAPYSPSLSSSQAPLPFCPSAFFFCVLTQTSHHIRFSQRFSVSSPVRSHLLWKLELTTAGTWGQLRVKWMMGNGVLDESAQCDLLTSVKNCKRTGMGNKYNLDICLLFRSSLESETEKNSNSSSKMLFSSQSFRPWTFCGFIWTLKNHSHYPFL